TIDGVNILPLIIGDKDANPRTDFYYYYRKNSLEAVQNGSFKLVLPHSYRTYEGFAPGNDGQPGEVNEHKKLEEFLLFDLRRDPGERYNVYNQYPEVVAQLMLLVEKAREDLGDDITNRIGSNTRPVGLYNQQ
ncbi:MAG: arylsulfatase, partial [Tannerellaceae bacterium]